MWIRKTQEEIEIEIKSEDLKIKNNLFSKSIMWSAISFVGFILFSAFRSLTYGPESRHRALHKPIGLDEYISGHLPSDIKFAAIIAIIVLIFSIFNPRLYRKKHTSASQICSKCFKTKNLDDEPDCPCGGQYEKLSYYYWKEETGESEIKDH